MTAATFDTLRIAKRLRDAGLSEGQAEALTDAIREGLSGSELVTKSDLAAGLAEQKADILKWMFGAIIAQGALVVTLVKLLPGK